MCSYRKGELKLKRSIWFLALKLEDLGEGWLPLPKDQWRRELNLVTNQADLAQAIFDRMSITVLKPPAVTGLKNEKTDDDIDWQFRYSRKE